MASQRPLIIFFTGATGYIGGTVLGKFVAHFKTNGPDVQIRTLVRTKEKADLIVNWAEARGVGNIIIPVLGSLDSEEVIVSEVSKADITVDTAHADHVPAANYFVKGLELAIKNYDGRLARPILIHTSGTGLLVDDSAGNKTTEKIYHDDNDDEINSIPDSAHHRDVDLIFLNFHKSHSEEVDIAVIAPPTIWGLGSGPESILSIQIPLIITKAIALKQAYNIGKGVNVWTQINVLDLADFYLLLLLSALKSPGQHTGFYFAENGEFVWNEVGKAIQAGLIQAGYTLEPEAKDTPTKEEYERVFLGGGGFNYAGVNGGNSRARAVRAKKLGWKPQFSSHQEFLWDVIQSVVLQSHYPKDNTRDEKKLEHGT